MGRRSRNRKLPVRTGTTRVERRDRMARVQVADDVWADFRAAAGNRPAVTGVVPPNTAETPRHSGIASTCYLRAGTAIRYQLGVPGHRSGPTATVSRRGCCEDGPVRPRVELDKTYLERLRTGPRKAISELMWNVVDADADAIRGSWSRRGRPFARETCSLSHAGSGTDSDGSSAAARG